MWGSGPPGKVPGVLHALICFPLRFQLRQRVQGGGLASLLSLRELVQRSSLIGAVFFSSVVALGTCSPAGSICSTVELKGDGLGCTDDKLQCKMCGLKQLVAVCVVLGDIVRVRP